MAKLPKCSIQHTRGVQLQNCKDASIHCDRVYRLWLPSILCAGYETRNLEHLRQDNREGEEHDDNQDEFFEGEYRDVGTIPVVFAIHGLGTDPRHIARYSKTADEYNFLFIIPEGINRSFNAGKCCGDAHKLGIHDVDFLHHIQQLLSDEFDFVQPEYSYGIGWDNGGLLLSEASIESPQIFKAIVPIAGYSTRTWFPQSVGTGIGIMMHHSLDDLVMRPSGCCDDPNMPVCRGPLASKSCVSVLDSFDLWARTVNLCTDEGFGVVSHDRRTLQVGGNDGTFYSVAQENYSTSMSLVSVTNDLVRASSVTFSTSQIPMSSTYNDDKMVCLTTTSSSCVANSTLCLYKEMDHFEGFASTPLMGDQVMEFFARDACGTNEGTLKILRKTDGSFDRFFCVCFESQYNGVFCLNERRSEVTGLFENQPLLETLVPETSLKRNHSVNYIVGLTLLVTGLVLLLMRKHRMQIDSYVQGNSNVAPRRRSFQDQLYRVKTKFESSMRGHGREGRRFDEVESSFLSCSTSDELRSKIIGDCPQTDQDCSNSSLGSFRSCRSHRSVKDIDESLFQMHGKNTSEINSENMNEQGRTSLDLDIELFKSFHWREQMVEHFDEKVYSSDRSSRRQGLLNDDDVHLLQEYRKKSSGAMWARSGDINLESQTGVYLDMQEPNRCVERDLDNSDYDSAISITSTIRSNESSNSIGALHFSDICSDDKSLLKNDDEAFREEAVDLHYDLRSRRTYDSKEYIRGILWDLDLD